jgi:carboxyl-terminal processing protease
VPVVVLVNAGTASAAEILSGAIQDHDMGMIVGSPTWGKGLVQTVYGLSYGAGLALTTAKYYTPSGRLIQRDYSSYFDYYYARQDDDEAPPPPADPGGEFATDLGRKVYGGGGITPDVLSQPSEVPAYMQFLLARNAFFDFAVDYTRKNKVGERDWQPEPSVLDQFGKWLVDEKIGTSDEVEKGLGDAAARDFALRQIRAESLNGAFGLESGHKALTAGDNQIQAALKLFDRAAALLASRQEHAQPKTPPTATGAPLG